MGEVLCLTALLRSERFGKKNTERLGVDGSIDTEQYTKHSLAMDLAKQLVNNGAICVSRRDVPDVAIFRAEIWVAPSPEKGGYL